MKSFENVQLYGTYFGNATVHLLFHNNIQTHTNSVDTSGKYLCDSQL